MLGRDKEGVVAGRVRIVGRLAKCIRYVKMQGKSTALITSDFWISTVIRFWVLALSSSRQEWDNSPGFSFSLLCTEGANLTLMRYFRYGE